MNAVGCVSAYFDVHHVLERVRHTVATEQNAIVAQQLAAQHTTPRAAKHAVSEAISARGGRVCGVRTRVSCGRACDPLW